MNSDRYGSHTSSKSSTPAPVSADSKSGASASGKSVSNGITLHYECFGRVENPAVLLVCGMAVQSIYWPDEMCHALADAGYCVVRFDNRDSGQSSYSANPPPSFLRNIIRAKSGRSRKIRQEAEYDLNTLVLDAVGLLDALGIDKAHWVGFSMGGMISQLAAADHSDRVLSLTSIMSSTNDADLPMPNWRLLKTLFPKRTPKEENRIVGQIVAALDSMSGTIHSVPTHLKADYARRAIQRGLNPSGPGHHMMAMMATGGFSKRLGKIAVPTLVIHGSADPLVHLDGGKRSAEKIPNAKLEVIEGMGHELPPSLYGQLIESILKNLSAGSLEEASSRKASTQPAVEPEVEVLIAGAGFSGMAMAIKLKEAGIEDFFILERGSEIGGTWRDNTYPGCACDVQSHLYSYSFALKHDWTEKYAGQKEIREYLRECATRYDLYPHIRFGVGWNGAEYDEEHKLWVVTTDSGKEIRARSLVMALGPLSNPYIPDIPGLASFKGESFHSASWNHDYDLSDKKVAVIGTGASAIQFVPEVAKSVASLRLFQRSPAWVFPKGNRSFKAREIKTFGKSSILQKAYRNRIFWRSEFKFKAFRDSESWMNRFAQREGRKFMERHIEDPKLREQLTPDYAVGCKRALLSDKFYPALALDHVDVVSSSIQNISESGVIDSEGKEYEVDAILFGTGFKVQDPLAGLSLLGRGGQCLREHWKSTDYRCFLGITTHGFPNVFMMTGPNTGLGHNSVVYMIEAQANYIIQALKHLHRGVVRSLEVRPEVEAKYSAEVQKKLSGTVWNSGCTSWYQADSGKNFAIWPDYSYRYKERCEHLGLADYKIESSNIAVEREQK